MAFRMLDSDRDGKLNAVEAVDFLICAGWCLLEEDLEEALGAAQRSYSLSDLMVVLRRLKSKKPNLSVAKRGSETRRPQ